MYTTTEPQDRIAELEDEIKEKERRLQELKAELDKANDLVERMRESVQDARDVIEAWKEAFDMQPTGGTSWTWGPWVAECEGYHDKYGELLRKWNRFVPEYNAIVAPRRSNVGRPLLASDAQRDTVLNLRKRGLSLRSIAEETSLGLNTVRTIVDQRDQRDRTSIKHLERIRRDMGEARTWQSRKRTRDSLPRRITALQQQSAELQKEAKGLK